MLIFPPVAGGRLHTTHLRRPFAHDPFAHGTPGEQAHASAVRRCSRFRPLFALVKSSLFALVKLLDRRVSVARNHSARTDPGKLA